MAKRRYKQMTFETAVRNPDRYLDALRLIEKYEGYILNDKTIDRIVCDFFIKKLTESERVVISEKTESKDIIETLRDVMSTRRGDGGFPKGIGGRFWTYMRTPSELGFVYARYNVMRTVHSALGPQEPLQ